MALSSSANDVYNVFLSFRGTDTRYNFTSHLHKALDNHRRDHVKVFIDNIDIERGEEITSYLKKIIEGVKLSIIIFSKEYASSTFCLDEMVKIMECKETKAQIVLPIFYKVYPSEETYQEAFTMHRAKTQTVDDEMKVENWKSSLDKAFSLAGWHIDDYSNEATIIETITQDVLKKLNNQHLDVKRIFANFGYNLRVKVCQNLVIDCNISASVYTSKAKTLYSEFPMASSSSANHVYDVFLSFGGTDVRYNFVSHLHKALCDNNVKAFIDDRNIDRGEEITSFSEGIIESVKLSIIVFSSDYTSSTFCLDEMVKIMECKETKGQIVMPIFYKVWPSEENYQEVFTTHREETVDGEMKVENWKSFFWKVLPSVPSYWRASGRHDEERKKQEMMVEKWKSSFDKAFSLACWHIGDYG